ncbi:peptide ABC transporter ATP-binding protein [Halobacteriales archaeon SW_12_71_31]|nr:MAG: peptide ABC transporter ATP-binding protein [Halobacteriales archaeon SW_12_71_31]
MSESVDPGVGEAVTTGPESAVETTEGDVLVEVEDLRTYYDDDSLFGAPVKAVDGVTFDVRRGETLGLVGESGCGKTTLGRTLVRLERPTDGRVLFDGTDVTTLSGEALKEWRRNAQIVFQDPDSSLNDRMTVGEIVREPLDVAGWRSAEERRDRVRNLLDTVGLQEEHYFRYPHQFSGGQRQRVGIARALALNPEFIVLDEPVSALDVSVQAKILNLLEDLQDEFGLTYLLIAHDLSVVRHICDRVAVMYLGHLMEIGNTEELFADPANPYTHSLLSAIPEADPTARKQRITLRGTPPNPRDPPTGCPFTTRCPAKIRPEEFADISDELWERVEVFREVLRERTRADLSVRQRVKRLLGRQTQYDDVDEVITDLFDDAPVDVPEELRGHVGEAADRVRAGDPAKAVAYTDDVFSSVCDTEKPAYYAVSGSGRESFCHRHDGGYESVDDVVERKRSNDGLDV